MKKILLIIGIFLTLPLIAQAGTGDPRIDKVTIAGPYGKGAAFSITVANFGDVGIGNLEVTFPDKKKAQITGKKDKTIQGVLPDDLLPQGGDLTVTLDKKSAAYSLKIPHITKIFIPENTTSNDSIIISGKNFEPGKCAVTLAKKSLAIQKCDYTQIIAKVSSTITGGELLVTSYGYTGAPYLFEISAPIIDFIESPTDIKPGGTVKIHGSGFKITGADPEVRLDKVSLTLNSASNDGKTIVAQLPTTSFTGKITVSRGGIESNGIRIISEKAPVLTSFSEEPQTDGTIVLTLNGKNFSEKADENSIAIGKSKNKATYAEKTLLSAPRPTNIAEGCLSVMTNNIQSNCLLYTPKNAPFLTNIEEPLINNDGSYSVKLNGSGLGNGQTAPLVYLKNAKQTNANALGDGIINLRITALPKNGTAYVINNGIKSNEIEFDWSNVDIPYINKITAAKGFSPGQRIIIEGVNFGPGATQILGHMEDRIKVKVNINNGGVSKDAPALQPYSIETYLDYKATLFKETTLSVTINGKKSNELAFSFDPKLTSVLAGPSLSKILTPEGVEAGKKIIIEGKGFSSNAADNIVFFKDQQVPGLELKGSKLSVMVPAGAAGGGKLHIETRGQKSNELPFLAAPALGKTFEIFFATPDQNSFDINGSKKREVVLAKLTVLNHLGNLKIKKMTFAVDYKTNSNDPDSVKKLGILPFREIELENKSVKGFDVVPAVATCELGSCRVTFRDFIFPPAVENQTYNLWTTVSSAVSDGSQVLFSISPSDLGAFSAENLERDNEKLLLSVTKPILSPALTFYNKGVACFDSQTDNRSCNAFLSGTALPAAIKTPLAETETPIVPTPVAVTETVTPPPSAEEPLSPPAKTPSSATLPAEAQMTVPVTAAEPETLPSSRVRKPLTPVAKTSNKPLIPFRDAAAVPWAQKYVNAFRSKQLVSSLPDNLFRPADLITSADFVAYLLTAFQTTADAANLTVPADPKAPVFRAQALQLILTAGGFKVTGGSNPFSDLSADQIPWVTEAYNRGLVRGVSQNKFEPNRSVTRAEAAKMILEAVDAYSKEVK
ncbi:IPT/TIG domain-containing protein [Candidatus Peregrinibacteria bacterium]|nr:IPT/TIG domain-containing protein [Candidatus Peregrinibacteria bacterium]